MIIIRKISENTKAAVSIFFRFCHLASFGKFCSRNFGNAGESQITFHFYKI